MATVQRFTADANLTDIVRALHADGCAIITELLPEGLIDQAVAEIRPYHDARPLGTTEFEGRSTRRSSQLVTRSAAYRVMMAHPMILGLVRRVMRHVTTCKLSATEAIEHLPGGRAQSLHRDHWKYDYFPFPKGYEVELNVMWAGTDFTADNGATRAVLGSHKWDDGLTLALEQSVPAEMPRGSCLIYRGSLYHGTGPNTSTGSRLGLLAQYAVGWVASSENFFLSTPPETCRALGLTEEQCRLIGYDVYADALNLWRDNEHPLKAVFPDREYPVGYLANTDGGGALAGGGEGK